MQVKRVLTMAGTTLSELRRQLVTPAAAQLPRLAAQAGALAATLETWVHRFRGRRDEASTEGAGQCFTVEQRRRAAPSPSRS